ncbi:MAG: SRPBCC family protein [Gemmatimonadota bacterium]
MTEPKNDLSLTVSRTIEAPVEKVFEAWLDPDMLSRFMTPGDDVTVPSVTVDAVEGGRFEIIMKTGDKEIPHSGVYETIDRPNRLVFTWESPHSIDGSTVTLEFASIEGGTEVTLTQVKFSSEDSRDGHEKGWTGILAALETTVETAGEA